MMRRLSVTVVVFCAVQILVPRPAFALWGILEKLSGPGPFSGPEFEFRLVCFGASQSAPSGSTLPGIESSCPVDTSGKKARSSINLGFRLFEADADPRYAGNRDIRLTTLTPSFSWSVFNGTAYDFLDVGVGGGVYWFSSEGFSGFSGAVLEPAWFDFHVPPKTGGKTNLRRALLEIVTFRIGWVVFPGGFEANAFNAVGSAARRIPSEALFQKGVHLDLQPLLDWARSH